MGEAHVNSPVTDAFSITLFPYMQEDLLLVSPWHYFRTNKRQDSETPCL